MISGSACGSDALIGSFLLQTGSATCLRRLCRDGAFPAVVLFLPIGVSCYGAAGRAGDLGWGKVIGSALLGAALMATPILLLRLKGRAHFRQDRG